MNKYIVKLVSGSIAYIYAESYCMLGAHYCFITGGYVMQQYFVREVESIEGRYE